MAYSPGFATDKANSEISHSLCAGALSLGQRLAPFSLVHFLAPLSILSSGSLSGSGWFILFPHLGLWYSGDLPNFLTPHFFVLLVLGPTR